MFETSRDADATAWIAGNSIPTDVDVDAPWADGLFDNGVDELLTALAVAVRKNVQQPGHPASRRPSPFQVSLKITRKFVQWIDGEGHLLAQAPIVASGAFVLEANSTPQGVSGLHTKMRGHIRNGRLTIDGCDQVGVTIGGFKVRATKVGHATVRLR